MPTYYNYDDFSPYAVNPPDTGYWESTSDWPKTYTYCSQQAPSAAAPVYVQGPSGTAYACTPVISYVEVLACSKRFLLTILAAGGLPIPLQSYRRTLLSKEYVESTFFSFLYLWFLTKQLYLQLPIQLQQLQLLLLQLYSVLLELCLQLSLSRLDARRLVLRYAGIWSRSHSSGYRKSFL